MCGNGAADDDDKSKEGKDCAFFCEDKHSERKGK